jgi:hypothetical protein
MWRQALLAVGDLASDDHLLHRSGDVLEGPLAMLIELVLRVWRGAAHRPNSCALFMSVRPS